MEVDRRLAHEQRNPLRHVDWRWRWAQALVNAGRHVSRRRDDPRVIDVVRYLRALARCQSTREREAVRRRWSAICDAHELVDRGGDRLWELQARILAGQGDGTIAANCGVAAQAVEAYESVFFAVRDRLTAGSWIVVRAIGIQILTGVDEHDVGTIWRALGYHGGVDVLEVAMAVTRNQELPVWVAELEARQPGYAERLRHTCRLLISALTLRSDHDFRRLLGVCLQAREVQAVGAYPSPVPTSERVARVLDETTSFELPRSTASRVTEARDRWAAPRSPNVVKLKHG